MATSGTRAHLTGEWSLHHRGIRRCPLRCLPGEELPIKVKDHVRELRRVRAGDLLPNAFNWRRHPDEQQNAMRGILAELGYIGALIVRETPEGLQIVDGHLRAEITADMEVPVLVVDLDDAEMRKALATYDLVAGLAERDNAAYAALADGQQWDNDAVRALVEKEAGYGAGMEGLTDEDEVPEPPEEPTAKLGDLWLCGDHQLLCGDATKAEDVERLMAGEKAAVLLTDPPYGISVVKGLRSAIGGSKPLTIGSVRHRRPYPFGGVKAARGTVGASNAVDANLYMPIHGDDKPFDPAPFLGLAEQAIIWGGNYCASRLPDSRCWLVWDKNNTGNFADAELAWTSFDKGVRLYRHTWNGLVREGSRDEEGIKRIHPTQKPVGMFGAILEDFTSPGAIILDPFLGSGTTMIACEKLGRRCYGMEIEPRYVDVAVRRWEAFTGQKATIERREEHE